MVIKRFCITFAIMTKRLITTIALTISLAAFGQKKYFRVENGLPSDFVVSMNVDKTGTVWIGTEEGVCSFNGVGIKNYSLEFFEQSSNDILTDKDGNLWMASQRAGFACFNPKTNSLRGYTADNQLFTPPLPSNEITHLAQDSEGNIWFSTYTKGLGKYDKTTNNIELFDVGHSIICFAIASDGKVYAGHYSSGITILDPKTKKQSHITSENSNLPSNQIGYVYCDIDNNIWIGTSDGIALYRPITNDFMVYNSSNSGLPANHIFSIFVSSDRRLLVSPNYKGVWYADIDSLHTNPRFQELPEAKDIKNLPVRAMTEDSFGNLWIGSYGRGVLFVGKSQSTFEIINNNDQASASVTAFIELRKGGFALGRVGGGVDLLDSKLNKTGSLNNFLSNRTTTALEQDSEGNLWVGTFGGRLMVVDENFSKATPIPIIEARDFLENGDTMWVASGLGLYAVDKKTKAVISRYSTRDNSLPEIYLRSLCVDCYGRLWLGSFRGGIMIFDKEMNLIQRIVTEQASFSNQINSLYYDGLYTIYAATGGGLVIYDISGDEIVETKTISRKDKISSNFIKSVIADNNHTIWFSTNLSICRYDVINETVTEYVNHYGSDFSIGNFNGNAAYYDEAGVLSFGCTEGLIRFRSKDLVNTIQAPTVHFREMSIIKRGEMLGIEQSQTLTSKSIKLNSNQRSLSLLFATDNYALSELTAYVCTIDNKELFQPSGSNHIVFSDLAPGNHTISVKARIGEGQYGPEDKLQIDIAYPIFWNPISQILYIVLIIIIILWVIWLYKKRLAEENRLKLERKAIAQQKDVDMERLRFYTDITHELRTPLTLILGPIKDIVSKELPDSIAPKLQIINKNASRLMDLVNRLLDFRKVETANYELNLAYADLSIVVENVARSFEESNTNKQINFIQLIKSNIVGYFDQEIITIILNNLLSNAFKYTEKGEICLEMKDKEGYAQIAISDTGYGIPSDKQQKIFERYYQLKDGKSQGTGIGLSLVKSLVDLHKGSIELESQEGMGSRFIVKIPLQKTNIEVVSEETPVEQTSGRAVIVVVEDNDDIREYIADILHKDYEIYTASNGQEALPIIESRVPDLVLTDIMMPVMDGLTLCRKIKRNLVTCHIPTILLTAKDTMQDRSEGYNSGGDSYITKPFTSELLLSRINNLLTTRKAIAASFASNIGNNNSMKVMEKSFGERDNKFLKKLRTIIEENISSEELDVEFLASEMNMSISTLYRKMKSMIGVSANEYIRKIRMHKAAELLESGDKNVSEASWAVGISSLIYFRQSFKNEFGVTPSEYLKGQRKV